MRLNWVAGAGTRAERSGSQASQSERGLVDSDNPQAFHAPLLQSITLDFYPPPPTERRTDTTKRKIEKLDRNRSDNNGQFPRNQFDSIAIIDCLTRVAATPS